MVVGQDWVEANGGTEAIRIIRYDPETGTQQVLETNFLGYDEKGRAVFEGISPDGLSVFGVVGLKVEKTEPELPVQEEPKTPEVTSGATQGDTELAPASENTAETREADGSQWWIIILILGIVAALATAWFFIIKRRIQEKSTSE